MKAQAPIIFSVILLLLPLQSPAADSANPFSFADPVVHIPSTAQDGTGQITLRCTVDQPTPPTLHDAELPHPPAATVKFALIQDANAPKNTWRFTATVTDLSPVNTMQQRYAVVEWPDKKSQTIPYFLTNQPASAFTWTISKPPDPWVYSDWLPSADCTSFTVTAKDSPATGLTLSAANLVEQVTKQAITARDLRLCRDEACTASDPIDLTPGVPTKLFLCTTRPFHGNYHGSVALGSLQKPDGDVILQNADFSSFLLKLLGFVAIAVGVYLAWWAKVWARARLERDQALMSAIVMRVQLRTLQQILRQLRQPYRASPAELNQSITALLGELDDAELDQHGFLPPRFPSPYGYTVDAAGYKTYLEARNPRIQLFSTLTRQGVVRAEAEDNGTLAAGQQAEVATAISDISRICNQNPLPTADQALVLVQARVLSLHNTLFPPPPGAPLAAPPMPASPAREYEVLSLEMQSISKGVWLLYGVLTALSGLVVLILNNPGFGIPVDLAFAFFWGFGLPTTVGALAPGSAATALNIPIAKS